MIFALLTLLTALSLAAVAGWFSIAGFMAIYAGAPLAALIMGTVTECAKLVTVSWLYRNWAYASWKLKAPLIYFTMALMVATSIGVFGFLSKGHLEQGASTINNTSRIETLNYQIEREKSLIADNEKVIAQLDATVNSFLGKDRTDRSLAVRKSQAPQRKQLRDESDAAQKRIDVLTTEKFKLESEIRSLQLEVGPIRYIAELFYGAEENSSKNIEAAVRIFTLLIVSTLDPLAVILLIAANHTLLRLKSEKEKTNRDSEIQIPVEEKTHNNVVGKDTEIEGKEIRSDVELVSNIRPENVQEIQISEKIQEEPLEIVDKDVLKDDILPQKVMSPVIQTPRRSRISMEDVQPEEKIVDVAQPNRDLNSTMREIVGAGRHFTPQKVIKPVEEKIKKSQPSVLSWLSEFKRI